MLVLPWPNLARLRVVEVVKGDVKPRSCIDLNDISRLAEGASRVAVHCCCFATVAGNRGCTLWIPRARVIQSYPC